MTTSRDWAEAKADEIMDALPPWTFRTFLWAESGLGVEHRNAIAAALREERAATTERAAKIAENKAVEHEAAASECEHYHNAEEAWLHQNDARSLASIAAAIRAASEGKG